MPATALDISALLAELGFDTPEGVELARTVLEEEKLTHAGKTRIDVAKRPRIEALLAERFLVTCGAPACNAAARDRIAVASRTLSNCKVCGGSPNKRAIDAAAEALQKIGARRIVVVGGSPAVHTELRALAPAAWEMRLIDGTARRTADAAKTDVRWADLVLLWGSSELDHKVSTLYVAAKEPGRQHVVHTNRRGIAALFEAAAEWARRRTSR